MKKGISESGLSRLAKVYKKSRIEWTEDAYLKHTAIRLWADLTGGDLEFYNNPSLFSGLDLSNFQAPSDEDAELIDDIYDELKKPDRGIFTDPPTMTSDEILAILGWKLTDDTWKPISIKEDVGTSFDRQ